MTIYLSLKVANNETKKFDCPAEKGQITQADAIADFDQGSPESKTYCYCTEDFSGRLNESFSTSDGNRKLCLTIYEDILRQVGFAVLIAFLLTVSSMMIDKLLKLLSGFEKYTDLNSQFSSRIFKGFVMKYGNSGLIILVINLKIRLFSSVSLGRYDDLTPTWYATIGYSVVFTYLLKFLTLIGWTVYRVLVPCLKRCCDRGCSNDMRKTKKSTMAEYIALYTGMDYDIDYSYTEILKTLFVCMTFGPILPIIYVISLVHLILLYYRDKVYSKLHSMSVLTFLVLKLYKFPPAFDERMNKISRNLLRWCIPIFCFSSIWAFGNPNILEKTELVKFDAASYANDVTDSNLDSFFGPIITFFDRSTNQYGFPFFAVFLVFFIIYILGFLFNNVLGLLFKILFGCCTVKLKKDMTKKDHWFDYRVASKEMSDEFSLYTALDQKNFYTVEQVKKFTEIRLRLYNRQIQSRGNTSKLGK